MDLSFTPLQDELRGQARAFLSGTPEPTWAQLAELGWTGAAVPEEHGGAALSFVEEGVLHEEAGRALLHAPFWSTSCLVPFLAGSDQAAVAAGETSWTLALGPLVPDLDSATHVAVVGGDTIYELEGFERETLATNDASRPLGVVSGGEPGRALCSSDILPALRSRSLAILALEAVGVGARALELAIEYTKTREQFGRAIGTYQAVSHPLATSYVDLELARSLPGGRHGASPTTRPRRRRPPPPRNPRQRTPPSPPASGRSRHTAGSVSPGSTCCTGSTSARSASNPGRRPRGSSARRSPVICSMVDGGGA